MEKAPVKHNRLRRMDAHDYASACTYLITVTTDERKRVLGKLAGDSPAAAHVEPSPLGDYTIAAFRKMAAMATEKTGCRVQVLQYQLMPDHFHGILYVRDALPAGWTLGKMIGAWKGDCSRAYWEQNADLTSRARNEEGDEPIAALTRGARNEERAGSDGRSSSSATSVSSERIPLFNRGYNDRILLREGQMQRWIEYLHNNPRRLWLKIHHPDRLRKTYDFQAGEQGHRYTAVGDTFLVTYPERAQVRCHRNLTPEQIQAEVEHYMRLAHSGVVLVSPFISPAEKAVYEACYAEKLRMIRIVNRGLDGRFIYPSGRDFDGCSAGFMLVLAPYADYSPETAATRVTRSQCLDMNSYAADLATIPVEEGYASR